MVCHGCFYSEPLHALLPVHFTLHNTRNELISWNLHPIKCYKQFRDDLKYMVRLYRLLANTMPLSVRDLSIGGFGI